MVLRQHLTISQTDDHEASSADIASRRIGHRQGKTNGYCGIDGIATLPQYFDSHFRGQRRTGADGPVAAADSVRPGGAAKALQGQQQRHQQSSQWLPDTQ